MVHNRNLLWDSTEHGRKKKQLVKSLFCLLGWDGVNFRVPATLCCDFEKRDAQNPEYTTHKGDIMLHANVASIYSHTSWQFVFAVSLLWAQKVFFSFQFAFKAMSSKIETSTQQPFEMFFFCFSALVSPILFFFAVFVFISCRIRAFCFISTVDALIYFYSSEWEKRTGFQQNRHCLNFFCRLAFEKF